MVIFHCYVSSPEGILEIIFGIIIGYHWEIIFLDNNRDNILGDDMFGIMVIEIRGRFFCGRISLDYKVRSQ